MNGGGEIRRAVQSVVRGEPIFRRGRPSAACFFSAPRVRSGSSPSEDHRSERWIFELIAGGHQEQRDRHTSLPEPKMVRKLLS